jgi:hypothetical integral membrane protein (TIGR02206 family)
MPLFGPLHLGLLALILIAGGVLAYVCRRATARARTVRLVLGVGLALNEFGWWWYRYSHEGFRFPHNMPLQLCDVTLWASVVACLTLAMPAVELTYFAGLAGAGMALLTPDLWSPWPSYPAIYFFVAHGGIVAAAILLTGGRIVKLRPGAPVRAFAWLAMYAGAVGTFNAVFGTNYMYLCRKPGNASLLDALGPWPMYLLGGGAVALLLFWILWLPVRQGGAKSVYMAPKGTAATP